MASIPVYYLVFLLIFAYGCAPKLDTVKAPLAEPEAFSLAGADTIPVRWWTSFEDPTLSSLVDNALKDNLNLAATWEQFMAARAEADIQGSFLWPQLEASTRSALSRPKPDFAGGENLQAGVSASYEVDLWGRIRSAKQAEQLRAQAGFFDYQAAAMSLSAEICVAYFRMLTAERQLDLVTQQIKTNEDIIKLIRARFGGGQIRAVDILRQEQLLESTRSLKIDYERDFVIYENQMAILLGRPPQNDYEIETDSLPKIKPLPKTGLPLELARRRPDILRSEALVMAADRDMAAAVRNKYPRLSLNLSTQARSNNYDALFKDWAYTLAGNILAPLFYGSRLQAEVDQAEALKNQLLYTYGQTVLNAFREVEDALVRGEKQNEQLEILERRLDLAKKISGQLNIEFLNGLSNYLDVLLALDEKQQLQRDKIDAELAQLEIRIALYRALAGGFSTARETETEQTETR